MIEDELLKLRFKCGSREALRCIYEKYLNNLLTLAMALLNDAGEAELLLEHARIAMEHARKTEHGGYSFYQGEMTVQAKHLSS